MYGNFIFSAVLYILAMQMLLSNLSVQKESEREQDCEKERERTGDSAEKGSIIINKKKEYDEERKIHCIEYWIYIYYVTDEEKRGIFIVCKLCSFFLIKKPEQKLCVYFFVLFVCCFDIRDSTKEICPEESRNECDRIDLGLDRRMKEWRNNSKRFIVSQTECFFDCWAD